MSYEPLHHKYRPQSFAQLVGQEAITTTLTNAIRTLKIAPAYLFTGPRGTGKTSSARILAKSLNCLSSDKPTPEPCGKCDVCRGITLGSTLDVIEIDAASNTGVDNIREIIERSQFAPVQCRYKVYAIDECHMLSNQAFNALLKTLEEPPKSVVFVLATTDPQRVLPTIISRTQRFDFRRIPLAAMVQHLIAIAAQESINITPEAVTLVAQISQGGLRDAESLLDQLSLLSGDITPERVWDLVGSVSEIDLLALLQAIAADKIEAVLDYTRNILDRGREPLIILQNLAAFYRDLLIAKTAPSRHDLVACTSTSWETLITQAQQFDISTILLGQQHLRAAEVQIKNTSQPRLWLEITLLGLLPSATTAPVTHQIPPRTPPSSRSQTSPLTNGTIRQVETEKIRQNNIEEAQSQPPSVTACSPDSVSPSSRQGNIEEETVEVDNSDEQASLAQIWQQVLASLPIPAQALLKQHGSLLSLDENVAVMGFPPGLIKLAENKLKDVEAGFLKICQRQVKVNLLGNNQVQKLPPTNRDTQKQPRSINQPSPYATQKLDLPPAKELKPEPTFENTHYPPTLPQSPTSITEPVAKTLETDLEAEEILRSAQNLANFFNGEIITPTDNAEVISNNSQNLSEMIEDADDDVEF